MSDLSEAISRFGTNSIQHPASSALNGLGESRYDMPALPSILVYGTDAVLLDTRRWVLEKAGYRVLTAQTLLEAERIAAVEPISIFLLCHSLPTEDCQKAVAAANTIRPEMKLLLMTANTPPCSQGHDEQVLSAFDGPQALIAAVQELLPESPTYSSRASLASHQ